jgi:glycosyltransferase involved in cell wall biosynthesis
MNNSVSIVIPCRNEEKYISKCIDSFLSMGLGEGSIEIIIVDGMSSDSTLGIIEDYQKRYHFIKLISNPKKKTPFALNLGILNATKEYILIASSHSSFDRNYIHELLKSISVLKADIVGGVMETKVINNTPKTKAICNVLSNKFGVGNAIFRTGTSKAIAVDTVPFGLYKRELFSQVGLYDEKLIRNHDIELSKRFLAHGKSIYLVPTAQCYYYARETYSAIAKNSFRNGYWNLLTVFITKKFSSLSLRHFIPLGFFLSIIMPLFGMVINPYFGILSGLSIFLYLSAVTVISYKYKDDSTSLISMIITFFCLHFSYGFGSFLGLLRIDKLIK